MITHVLGLAKAVKANGLKTEVFLTGDGVHLTQHPSFSELLEVARIGICEVSYFNRGYAGTLIQGLQDKDFVTQHRNAELVEKCERYFIL